MAVFQGHPFKFTKERLFTSMSTTKDYMVSPFTGNHPFINKLVYTDSSRLNRFSFFHVTLQARSEAAEKSVVGWTRKHNSVPDSSGIEFHL